MSEKNHLTTKSLSCSETQTRNVTSDNPEEMVRFLTRQYLENIATGTITTPLHKEMAEETEKLMAELPIGAHLVTPRTGYLHHGLYIGEGRVIHYAGLADNMKSAPVEETSLEAFRAGYRFWVEPHHNSPYTPETIVRRARQRMSEDEYSVIWNNCEHFVNWCIDNYHSSRQVNNVVAHTVGRIPGAGGATANVAQAVVRCRDAMQAYLRGDIDENKLFEESAQAAGTTAMTVYFGAATQMVMPYAPGIGFMIGSAIGLAAGSMMQRAGLFTLGESGEVQVARDRRQKLEALCEKNRMIIQKSRAELNQFLDTYFEGRREVFDQAFQRMDAALQSHDTKSFTDALEAIANQFGNVSIKFGSQEDFDRFMESDESFQL